MQMSQYKITVLIKTKQNRSHNITNIYIIDSIMNDGILTGNKNKQRLHDENRNKNAYENEYAEIDFKYSC